MSFPIADLCHWGEIINTSMKHPNTYELLAAKQALEKCYFYRGTRRLSDSYPPMSRLMVVTSA